MLRIWPFPRHRQCPDSPALNPKTEQSYFVPFFMCAQHGRCLAGERPVWRLVAATISQGQGRHCEVGSGGSRRQTCDLRNTKPIRGCEVGRVGMKQRSPMQPKTKAVNWTSAQGKSAFLPGETCCQAFFLGVTLVEKSD